MFASFVFNETSPSTPTTVASSQAVGGSAFAAGVAGPLDDYDAVRVVGDLVGATGGTLDVFLQASPDGGANFYDVLHWPQLAPGAAATKLSASFSLGANATAPVVVGKNLAPALAAGTVINGPFTDRFRLVFVAGAGTIAGAPIRVTIGAQRKSQRR